MNPKPTLIDLLHQSPPNQFVAADFRSPGFLLGKTDPRVLDVLNQEVNAIKSDFSKGLAWNHELAGQIKNEYFLTKSFEVLEPYFVGIAHHYNRQFFGMDNSEAWELLDLCVNFQAKHEYNPPHTHTGLLSFTLWLRVPFNMEDEMQAVQSRQTTNACAANFAFIYNQADGKIAMENIPVDKRFEGVICIFPANIHHTVYPFTTSDEFRVSIAGNLGPKGRYPSRRPR